MPDLQARTVISNTSPLFYLHRIERLDLLRQLYGRVCVPEQVAEELRAGGPDALWSAYWGGSTCRLSAIPMLCAWWPTLAPEKLPRFLWPSNSTHTHFRFSMTNWDN